MKGKSKKSAKPRPAAKKKSQKVRQSDPAEGPRSSAMSSLSKQALSQGAEIGRDTEETPLGMTDAGDLTSIREDEISSTESVPELIDEGQDREAEILEAIEDAPDADQGEVRIRAKVPNKIHGYKDRNRI